MKRLILILIPISLLFACKKQQPNLSSTSLVGKWNFNSIDYKTFDENAKKTLLDSIVTYPPAAYIQFNADGTGSISNPKYTSAFTYHLATDPSTSTQYLYLDYSNVSYVYGLFPSQPQNASFQAFSVVQLTNNILIVDATLESVDANGNTLYTTEEKFSR